MALNSTQAMHLMVWDSSGTHASVSSAWSSVVSDHFAVAFDAGPVGKERQFGVSGLLYNSDVLLYDRATESLWSQLLMQAISGPAKGTRLMALPAVHTSWRAWREKYPGTMVLSVDTGFARDYSVDPYAGYDTDTALYFPVRGESRRYHPKERVLGVEGERWVLREIGEAQR